MATIYVRNLDERIKLAPLKDSLAEIYGKYGSVLGVHAKKSLKMRGQAFVDFGNAEEALAAIKATDGTEILGSIVRAELARSNSDTIHKIKTGAPRKRKASDEPQTAKRPKIENNVLFIEGMPHTVTKEQLQAAYESYEGFVEARVFALKGVGFVEFSSIDEAKVAVKDPVTIAGESVKVSFAAK